MDKLTEQELAALANAETDAEWNSVCAEITACRGGRWPSDWAEKVLFGDLRTKLKLGFTLAVY